MEENQKQNENANHDKNQNQNEKSVAPYHVNQKIKDIKIFCKDIKLDQPKNFISDDIDIFIECEEDILCVFKYSFS